MGKDSGLLWGVDGWLGLWVSGNLLAGSMAGVAYWLSCYPLDVVKNRMQAAPDSTPPRYRGMVRQLRHQFGPFLAHFSAPSHPARAVYCALLGARVLIGS